MGKPPQRKNSQEHQKSSLHNNNLQHENDLVKRSLKHYYYGKKMLDLQPDIIFSCFFIVNLIKFKLMQI
jgi:hypothetical protein